MYILGLSCFYHDSAAALIKDGKVIAAAHEERFTRIRHDENFPEEAVEFCLNFAKIAPKDLTAVAFYDKPFLKFERLLTTYFETWPKGVFSWAKAMPVWLSKKLWIKSLIQEKLDGYSGKIYFPEHHLSHAASAFLVSPFEKAAILTIDGVGEWATATKSIGDGTNITLTHQIDFPHSLGLLYSAFTYYTGFKVNSAEYKVMGLAPYGKPIYAKLILDNLIDVKPDGSFKMNMKYFAYPYGLTMTNNLFCQLFNHQPAQKGQKPAEFEMDIAASIQAVTDEIMLRLTRSLYQETKLTNLCMAGGVALNCVSNGKILKDGKFKSLFIQPAAGDAGGALGAAEAVYYGLNSEFRIQNSEFKRWAFGSALLGPEYSDTEIKILLDKNKLKYKKLSQKQLTKTTASLISDQKVVGWFQGRMEWGPRALGARSILADARNPENQKRVNLAIKFRESFRPFAPVVMEDKMGNWFDATWTDPYMITVCQVKNGNKVLTTRDNSQIPAVTHLDGSARIQTVNRKQNPLYYDVIHEFYKKTGVPVLINTSFNRRGEPIVCAPQNALDCFLGTNIDNLAIGSFLLDKKNMPENLINTAKAQIFAPD
ncbi:carbamoyltransferase [Candidatus Collierbacteria bacterium]|nr:carbamoyltransferase [Candidatus Collierbacteria bacterium]